ncbi:hypothetical protein E2C01_006097 [Portunus trituberculatus]|uniref:Uncharacterized protein n=1 Tax=Portunus trituberculatus TaxID=210409 RepID=A0A5B7CYC9_PORTR|nr:hypothetical protein [Portunus trituberculatus]
MMPGTAACHGADGRTGAPLMGEHGRATKLRRMKHLTEFLPHCHKTLPWNSEPSLMSLSFYCHWEYRHNRREHRARSHFAPYY